MLHRCCQAALFCGASGTILRTPYPPKLRGRMAIRFLAAALSSVSSNAKKPTLDLAQDVFDIVRHAFRSGVNVLNLYYVKRLLTKK
jgi:hypothetical protein